MKRIAALLFSFGMLFVLTACYQSGVPDASEKTGGSEESVTAETGEPFTEVWTEAGSSVCAWFSGDEPDYSMGVNDDPLTIRIGKTSEGKDIFSLLRLPMRGTFLADEISDARLHLKITDGIAPSSLRAGLITDSWNPSFTTIADAWRIIDSAEAESFYVRTERDGWVSIDITNYVVGWLNGTAPNYGIALLGETDGEQTTFSSDWDENSENPPRLEVTGAISERRLAYGKFGYMRHPEKESGDAAIAENEVANCLSYALRDINIIGADDLGLDYK